MAVFNGDEGLLVDGADNTAFTGLFLLAAHRAEAAGLQNAQQL